MNLYKHWIPRVWGQRWALWASVAAYLLLTIGWLGAIGFSAVLKIIE